MHLSNRGRLTALSVFVIWVGCAASGGRQTNHKDPGYDRADVYTPPAPITTEVVEVHWRYENQYPWAGHTEVTERAKIRVLNRVPQMDDKNIDLIFECEVTREGWLEIRHGGEFFPRNSSDIYYLIDLFMQALVGCADYNLKEDAPGMRFDIRGVGTDIAARFNIRRAEKIHDQLEPILMEWGTWQGKKIKKLFDPADWHTLPAGKFLLCFQDNQGQVVSPGENRGGGLTLVTDCQAMADLIRQATIRHRLLVTYTETIRK